VLSEKHNQLIAAGSKAQHTEQGITALSTYQLRNVTVAHRSHVINECRSCSDFLIIRVCDDKSRQFQVKVTQVGKDIRYIADRLKWTTESIEDRKKLIAGTEPTDSLSLRWHWRCGGTGDMTFEINPNFAWYDTSSPTAVVEWSYLSFNSTKTRWIDENVRFIGSPSLFSTRCGEHNLVHGMTKVTSHCSWCRLETIRIAGAAKITLGKDQIYIQVFPIPH
jgi:hypothetical protein